MDQETENGARPREDQARPGTGAAEPKGTRLRRPRRVYDTGDEPDPRFTLANERTLLAWLRTAIAFAAAGVGFVALSELADLGWLVDLVAFVSFVGGGATAALGYLHWQRVERAMRQRRPLPAPVAIVVVLAAGLAMVLLGGMALIGIGL